jgi:hypothetical protein
LQLARDLEYLLAETLEFGLLKAFGFGVLALGAAIFRRRERSA